MSHQSIIVVYSQKKVNRKDNDCSMENYILHSAAVCSCRKDKVLFCHTKTAAARKSTSQNVYALNM